MHYRYIISDVHSRADLLAKLLDKLPTAPSPQSAVLFLGDLNDSRNPLHPGSFLDTLNIVNPLMEAGAAEVLHSNHQRNLLKWINGDRKKCPRSLQQTADELTKNCSISQLHDISMWLQRRPWTAKFTSETTTYLCAHAYYDTSKPEGGSNTETICGPVGQKPVGYHGWPPRLKWWLTKRPPANTILVAGHYHIFYRSHTALILDPYGDFNDGVAVWDTRTNQLITVTDYD